MEPSASSRGGSAGESGWIDDTVAAAVRAGLEVVDRSPPSHQSVIVNGRTLRYLDWGNQHLPDLLFLHGFAQQSHSWDFAALGLRSRFHAIAVDMRGHGDSDWAADGDYSFDGYLSDVEELIDAIALSQPVICGLSMGGHLTYMYVSRHPDRASAAVIAEAAPETRDQGKESVSRFTSGPFEFDSLDQLVMRIREYSPHRPVDQIRGALVHSVRQTEDGKWRWKYDPRIRDARGRGYPAESLWNALEGIRVPTLFVTGADSDMISRGAVSRMLEAVPGSTWQQIDGAGHRVAGDNPLEFHRAVSHFFDGLPDRPREGERHAQ